MLKLAGTFLLLLSGTGMGLAASAELTHRERFLVRLGQAIAFLSGEIRYGISSLPEGFRAVSRRMPEPWKGFFQELAEELEHSPGESLQDVFTKCAAGHLPLWELSAEERELFLSLGGRLGYLDKEMQLKQLKLCGEELEFCLKELRTNLSGRKKIRRILGMLGGVFLSVMLW